MKLQNLAVIFVIIIMPISLVLSSYIDNRVETLKAQLDYDEKLYDSTYDAIIAYQKNTVNSSTSNLVNSKLRDIEASASAFLKSAAENFNLQGTGRKAVESFVPALVYTLYDGYYIYAPYTNILDDDAKEEMLDAIQETKDRSTNEEDRLKAATYHDGDLLNGLKPYVYYSCRYVHGDIDVVINYSLDSYVIITGKVGSETVNLQGYLLSSADYNSGTDTVTYRNIQIDRESMTQEKLLVTNEEGDIVERTDITDGDKTIFDTQKVNGTKYYRGTFETIVYHDDKINETYEDIMGYNMGPEGQEDRPPYNWRTANDGAKIESIISPEDIEEFGEENRGKLVFKNNNTSFILEEHYHYDYISDATEVFYNLNSKKIPQNGREELFATDNDQANDQARQYYITANNLKDKIQGTGLENIQIKDAVDEQGNPLSATDDRFSSTTKIFAELDNSYDLNQTQIEDDNSDFNNHKLDVIKHSIEKNLSVAISNYNNLSNVATEFKMPKLKEEEWDRISKNISVIAFLQGVQAGSKEYNGYAVVNNNKNEHFVSKDSIYISIKDGSGNEEYHNIRHSGLANLINAAGATNARGYFNVDYEIKNGTVGYYCPRDGATECYNCMITADQIDQRPIEEILRDAGNEQLAKIYYTALARERQGMYRIANIYDT